MALVLVVFFSWTGRAELVNIEPRPVNEWLAAQPDDTPSCNFRLKKRSREAVEAQPRLKHVVTLDNQAVFELID